ncbi:GNAT family N-acetyltransferase [Bosea sp. BH3]|uniref:GNAT family N-acetyltransferase n=1 Tax=Bosea sp. BH3 TaxID=2871701 RepID=UPI0021CB0562|nr:GNAT family N-acetyltransferase [Bosea sp. BH3]MCU4179800.1 GNAT family N-acetyltransferase [Bosea sp. BH3]
MGQETIDLVAFDERHLDGAVLLSRETGWPHRREDWAMVLALSHGFVALQGDVVVGTAMLTPFGDDCATVNMVIVAASMRGRGLGRKLMDAALQACGARECRLTATADGLPLYEKLGFSATHEIRQHQGIVTPLPADAAQDALKLDWAGPESFPAVAALDLQALGMDRRPLLRLLTEAGRMVIHREAGRIVGYAAMRRFGRGEVIGPVVANTLDQAQSLLSFLIASRPGAFLRVDTAEWQQLSPWLSAHGLVSVGGGIAMRRNVIGTRPLGPAKPFALASQALG